jgi:hypothetical protein
MAWPKFRESDEAGIKRIFSYIVGDASVMLVRGLDKGLQVRQDLWHLVWREAKDSKYGD